MHGYPKRKYITEKWVAELLKQIHHLAFDLGRLGRRRCCSEGRETQSADRICRGYPHRFLYKYTFPFLHFCSKILGDGPWTLRRTCEKRLNRTAGDGISKLKEIKALSPEEVVFESGVNNRTAGSDC